jgi:hypothetical protein
MEAIGYNIYMEAVVYNKYIEACSSLQYIHGGGRLQYDMVTICYTRHGGVGTERHGGCRLP